MATTTVWESENSAPDDRDMIRFNDTTNTYRYIADSKDVVSVTLDGISTVIAMQGHGTIHSNGDLRIYLDKNQVEGQPSNAKLKVFNGANTEVFGVNEQGEVDIHQGAIETRIGTRDAATGMDDFLIVATGMNRRGRIEIRNQPESGVEGQEFYLPKKAGILVLYDEGGRENFLWVDSSGRLRVSRSDPGANDLSGTVVGAQS